MGRRKKPKEIKKPNLIDEVDNNLGWLFIALVVILPLLVRAKIVEFITPKLIASVLDTGLKGDIFSYYKWIFLISITVIILVVFLFKVFAYRYEIKESYINIPLLLVVLLVSFSALTSEYKGIALIGLYDQYGGTLTYLCYFLLLFVAANTVFREWFSRYITAGLGIFVVINLIIILFHFYGNDLYQSGAISSLIGLNNYANHAAVSGELWSTLENPNYVSGLAAALFAFFLAYVLLENRFKQSVLYIILSLCSFAIMLASLSTSGFVSILIIAPVIIVIAFLSQNKKRTLIAAGVSILLCVVVFLGMNAHNPRVYDETLGVVKNVLPSTGKVSAAIAAEGNTNQNKNQSNSIQMQPNYFKLPAPGMSFGTGRGYIWKETLKLIKQRPLTGYGQDTIVYYFPQNDINKIAELGSYDTLVGKPHNMYLEIAFGSGIPALLALLGLFFTHLYYTGRYFATAKRNRATIFPAALFLFFCTFLVQWLFNDSVIGSSVIFWTLLGVGVSLNTQLIND